MLHQITQDFSENWPHDLQLLVNVVSTAVLDWGWGRVKAFGWVTSPDSLLWAEITKNLQRMLSALPVLSELTLWVSLLITPKSYYQGNVCYLVSLKVSVKVTSLDFKFIVSLFLVFLLHISKSFFIVILKDKTNAIKTWWQKVTEGANWVVLIKRGNTLKFILHAYNTQMISRTPGKSKWDHGVYHSEQPVITPYYNLAKCYCWEKLGKVHKGFLWNISYNCMWIYNSSHAFQFKMCTDILKWV